MVDVTMTESSVQGLLGHALEEAKSSGNEVLGWLTGYRFRNEIFVMDAVQCRKYLHQSRVGAHADPMEEFRIATGYPRNAGIVGLYHSHPFRDDYHAEFRDLSDVHSIFHSHTDDETLIARGGKKNTLSVVTDGVALSCFAMEAGKVVSVEPKIINGSPEISGLKAFSASLHIQASSTFLGTELTSSIREVEQFILNLLETMLVPEKATISSNGKVSVQGLDSGSGKRGDSTVMLKPTQDGFYAELDIRISPKIFTVQEDPNEVLCSLRNELADDLAYLLWDSVDYKRLSSYLWSDVESVCIFMGKARTMKGPNDPLPRKSFIPPKRKLSLHRARR